MTNFLTVVVIAAIVGGAIGYIYKAKKAGQVCIGCPHAQTCASKGCCENK